MPSPIRRHLLVAVVPLAVLVPSGVRAQGGEHDHGARETPPAAAEQAMGAPHVVVGPHMRLTPERPATAADSARAAALLATLRGAIERYRDVRVAEAEGYRMFALRAKRPRVLHFTNRRRAIRERSRFDPAQPTSLLYRRNGAGELELLGAMYVAPKDASLEELDARVPLSIARWHAHVNVCVPPPREPERWSEVEDGRMRFGPAGAITTEEQCDAAGGRFHEQRAGWMVHVNAFAEGGAVWGGHHAGRR